MMFAVLVLVIGLVGLGFLGWVHRVDSQRLEFIRKQPLPVGLFDALRKRYPHLSRKDCELAGHALRHFFLAHAHSGRRFVSMPSQAADELWHAFILDTRAYKRFCERAFGRFLHHTPAVALGRGRHDTNVGLRRTWWHACREENLDARRPSRLPLLFALDMKLALPDGFRYAIDCHAPAMVAAQQRDDRVIHCAGDFGSSDVDGSIEGFGDGGGDGGASGCGGGCGGGD